MTPPHELRPQPTNVTHPRKVQSASISTIYALILYTGVPYCLRLKMSGNDEADALLVSDSDSEGETSPAVVERRRKSTLDWRPGTNVFATFEEFSAWTTSSNVFHWVQNGHSKNKLLRERNEWYQYV